MTYDLDKLLKIRAGLGEGLYVPPEQRDEVERDLRVLAELRSIGIAGPETSHTGSLEEAAAILLREAERRVKEAE